MTTEITLRVNFYGGIISPGDLYNILVAATRANVHAVRFGLRQQMIIAVSATYANQLDEELRQSGYESEAGNETYPNIASSYPAEDVFIQNTWLSEGVYKDILDAINYRPRLKINISDSNQSFTPLLTGNINWVASPDSIHYWHLFVRFPKTNTIFEWDQLVYTNDIARLSLRIEQLIFEHTESFYNYQSANGELLFSMLESDRYILKQAAAPASLPAFNLPYYEGLNRYNNKYWLGIYRRDELFSVELLKELCLLCLNTRIGQICSTPWKSLIIKGIEEGDKPSWNRLLEKYQVNMRHAANELNFQVEDDSPSGLRLKNFLVKQLNNEDIRTFGICFGIKTRRKSEVFSSILVKRKYLFNILGFGFCPVYDILCAQDFNPNKRTAYYFSRNNPLFVLGEQLRRAVLSYYHSRIVTPNVKVSSEKKSANVKSNMMPPRYHCKHCLTVYHDAEAPASTPERKEHVANVAFNHSVPDEHVCELCESPASDFILVDSL